MRRINDRVALGIVSGMLGSIPGRLLNAVEYRVGLTDSKYGDLAASLFVGKSGSQTAAGVGVGRLANELLAASTGVATAYLLSATGRDYAAVKGVGVTSMAWLAFYGLASGARMVARPKRALSPLLAFVDHVIFGISTSMAVCALGDEALFRTKSPEGMPLTRPLNGPRADSQSGDAAEATEQPTGYGDFWQG